jgi:hypothetical protein
MGVFDKTVTLESLVASQKWNGMSDIEIIKAFFNMNDMEEEGIRLVSQLTEDKIAKLKHKHHMSEEWACMIPSIYLYKNYEVEIANRLHNLELDYLVNGGELTDFRLEWARKNVPDIEQPEAFFNPLLEYLEEKGIRFKERKKTEEDDDHFTWG